jgi:bacterial/archaeal transporter family-2 protein
MEVLISDKFIWIALAFLAGSFMPIQGAFNARLGNAGSSLIHASLVSFSIGTLSITAYILAARQSVSWTGLASAPWFAWLGGSLGAFSLTMIILAYPRLGPALAFGLVVAGQLIVSVLLEHLDILVAQRHPINLPRIAGIMLILGGVGLIRKF